MFVLVKVIYTVSLASRVVFKTLANSQLCISYAAKARHWLWHMHRVRVRMEEDDTETLQCVLLSWWTSSRHTHALQHVLTQASTSQQMGEIGELTMCNLICAPALWLEDKRSRAEIKGQHHPAGGGGGVQTCPIPLLCRTHGSLVWRRIVPLSWDRAGIV